MKVNLVSTCANQIDVTFKREKVETFHLQNGGRNETDYNERVFKFKDTLGRVMKYKLYHGNFIIDGTGLKGENSKEYLTTWYREYKVNLVNDSSGPVTVTFKREGKETHPLAKKAGLITDYNDQTFRIKDAAGRVMDVVLHRGDFVIDQEGLLGEIDMKRYALWSAKIVNNLDSTDAKISKFIHPAPGTKGISRGFDKKINHFGIDFMAKKKGVEGDSILAFYKGKVCRSEKSNSYGLVVYINHVIDGKHYQSRYAHLRQKPSVNIHDEVKTGTLVGYMGQTGDANGVHLHFEIRKSHKEPTTDNSSVPIDPLKFLPHN